eukprot:COSAG01_NODE_3297_length_6298_cov_2.316341_8_plen_75_part_00
MSPDELLNAGKTSLSLTATATGTVNAVVFWFELTLDDSGAADAVVQTAPGSREGPRSAWGQALQWLAPPDGPQV